MRALITGVAGFAGSHLAEHLLASGDQVIGTTTTNERRATDARLEAIEWDIRSPAPPETVGRIQEFAPQWIFHLAAISVPARCGADEPTQEAIQVNVAGTEHVLQLLGQIHPSPRLVFTSTSYVYPGDITGLVDETTQPAPRRGYGKSKWMAEQQLARSADLDSIDYVVARAFNHAGPRQLPGMLVSDWASQFADPQRDPIQVHSMDGVLDLTDVRDVVQAYRSLADSGQSGQTYNVGSARATSTRQLWEIFTQLVGARQFQALFPGPKQQPIADTTKLRSITGWEPRIPIETTIRDTLQYWQQNQGTNKARGEPS